MKHNNISAYLACAVIGAILLTTSTAFAFRTGMTGLVFGPGTGAQRIFQGEPVMIEGVVSDTGYLGNSVEVDTGTEMVRVFGMGPAWYWEQSGSAFPAGGEPIAINGRVLTMSDGSKKIVATTITMYQQKLELREPDTGVPAWRRAAWEYAQMHSADGNYTRTVPYQHGSPDWHYGPGNMGQPNMPGGFMGWNKSNRQQWVH